MIRFVQCVRRREDLPVEDFRRHWQTYLQAFHKLAATSKARRISSGFGLAIPRNSSIQALSGTLQPFDAVLELWWESGAEIDRLEQHPEIQQAIEAIRQMQGEFIDLQTSSFFFASDDVDRTLA